MHDGHLVTRFSWEQGVLKTLPQSTHSLSTLLPTFFWYSLRHKIEQNLLFPRFAVITDWQFSQVFMAVPFFDSILNYTINHIAK